MWVELHLCGVDIIQHDNGCAVVVEDQAPEVLHRVGQRMLGNDECSRLSVALKRRRETTKAITDKEDTLNDSIKHY